MSDSDEPLLKQILPCSDTFFEEIEVECVPDRMSCPKEFNKVFQKTIRTLLFIGLY